VIAPYASALAALVAAASAQEPRATGEPGALGPYGFRDALDYTRPDDDQRYAVVGNFMAHHIGMSLVALTNVLTSQIWQRRFHADPMVRSAELLLHERIPRRLLLQKAQARRPDEAMPAAQERPAVREVETPDTPQPHIAILGHLPYTIMVSHCGSGYSRYETLAVTRWQSDGCRDATGQFLLREGRVERPGVVGGPSTGVRARGLVSRRARDRPRHGAPRRRRDRDAASRSPVVPMTRPRCGASPVTNNGDQVREIELTSYGEVVLAPPETDRSAPAFGNLFVETEWHEWCTRSPPRGDRARAPSRSSGACTWSTPGKERVGPGDVRDRPRSLPRDAAARARSAGPARRRADSPAPPAPWSIRSSLCARACGSIPGSPPRSRSRRWSPTLANGPSSSRIAITMRTRPSARSTSRRPRARWS
jgi:cyclic beta-1,2-glucan synthetase